MGKLRDDGERIKDMLHEEDLSSKWYILLDINLLNKS